MDLSRVVSLANGKGGVGKTSLTANLAGEFAREGSRTLVVDLDVSGNLKLDLGLVGHEGDDPGRGEQTGQKYRQCNLEADRQVTGFQRGASRIL